MASPQTGNGFTPIANELLEQIYSRDFSGTQLRIVLAVCRYTYGFSRKEAELSLSYISTAIGVSKRFTKIELTKLFDAKVLTIIKESTYSSSRVISLNKNYDEWGIKVIQLNNTSTVEQDFNSTGEVNFNSTGEVNIPQDNQLLKQDIKQKANELFEKVWKAYPNKLGKGQVSQTKKEQLLNVGEVKLLKCIEKYKATKPSWKEWQHGSTFFNSGYIDYLDAEVKPVIPQEIKINFKGVIG